MRRETWIIVGSMALTGFIFGSAGPLSVAIVGFGFLIFGND